MIVIGVVLENVTADAGALSAANAHAHDRHADRPMRPPPWLCLNPCALRLANVLITHARLPARGAAVGDTNSGLPARGIPS